MAPEIHGFITPENCFREDSSVCRAGDIWAVGEITFRLLTSAPAFPTIALLSAYVQDRDRFPVSYLKHNDVTEQCSEFIGLMMDPYPKKRVNVERALSHSWLLPCRPPSPKAASILSVK